MDDLKIYDIKLDGFREPTQEDIDILARTAQAFGQLFSVLKAEDTARAGYTTSSFVELANQLRRWCLGKGERPRWGA